MENLEKNDIMEKSLKSHGINFFLQISWKSHEILWNKFAEYYLFTIFSPLLDLFFTFNTLECRVSAYTCFLQLLGEYCKMYF